MEFTKLLEERRSIRAFDPEKHVTAEQIQEIVQAAIQAPSWKKLTDNTVLCPCNTGESRRIFRKMPSRIQSEEFKGSRTCRNSIRKRPLRIYAGRHTRQRSWKRLGLLRSRPARRKPDSARKRTRP